MDIEIMEQLAQELAKGFFHRPKHRLNPGALSRLKQEDLLLWAWGTGMGSDLYFYAIKNDGTLWKYDHHSYRQGKADAADLPFLPWEQAEGWLHYKCRFHNKIFLRPEDKEWFEMLWTNLPHKLRSPYVFLEFACRMLLD